MLDELLINHCSPTLAGLKTASLINVPWSKYLPGELKTAAQSLASSGVSLMILYRAKGKALIYVYRKALLCRDLSQPEQRRFLSQYGYRCEELAACLRHLQKRIQKCGAFPHEIGAFLGYPLHDVIGFIQNGGKNCRCAGCWKVYCDECGAKEQFAKLKRCKALYQELFRQGITVSELARPA